MNFFTFYHSLRKKKQQVSRLNGSHRLILINTLVDSPRAIVVYPQKGYLFWTDWSSRNPKIERASSSGEDRVVLVNKTIMDKVLSKKSIGWPNGLTIDYPTDTVYWIDAKEDIIVKMDINGSMFFLFESITHKYF